MCNCSNANFYSDNTGFHFCQNLFDSNEELITGGTTPPPVADKILLQATSNGDQTLTTIPEVLTGIVASFTNKVSDLGLNGYEFLADGKVLLKMDIHLKNNSPQERVWFWVEKLDGSSWEVVPDTAKYFEFGYNTEGIKTYFATLNVLAGQTFRLQGASETGTVKIGHRDKSFGPIILSSNAIDLILFQLD